MQDKHVQISYRSEGGSKQHNTQSTIDCQNGVNNRNIHANFALLGVVLIDAEASFNSVQTGCVVSAPNMTGRGFHRTPEAIPCRPWKSERPFASTTRPFKICKNTATQGRNDAILPSFISIVRSPRRPIVSVPNL